MVNNKQQGGKFLGKGTYGCVYNPPIPCKGTDDRDSSDYVSKVMSKKEASSEMKEANIIRKIDPKSNFALYGLKECDIVSVTKSDENCLKDCTHLKPYVSKQKKGECKVKKLSQLVMKNGGYSLEYDKNKSLFKVEPQQLLRPMYDIFVGLNKIKKAGYLHRDIKNPNLVYNENLNKFYLIDFGLMESIDNTFTWEGIHYHKYPWYPLDWNYLFTINKIITDVISNNMKQNSFVDDMHALLIHLFNNWFLPRNTFRDDVGPIVSYKTSEMYTYQENILKSLKKYFGKEIHQLYKKYIDIEEQYNLKKITKKKIHRFYVK